MPPGPFARESDYTTWLADRSQRPATMLYTILAKDHGRIPAGLFMLLGIDPALGSTEIGLVYGSALRRQTAGTEAFALLAGHVFDDLGYRRLEWRCDTGNAGSMRAARRFGFTLEGTLRQNAMVKGRIRDTACFGILDSEWKPIRRRLADWLDPANFRPDGTRIRPLSDPT